MRISDPAMSTEALQVVDGTLDTLPEPLRLSKGGAALFNPCGLAVSAEGHQVFIADTGHHRICVLEDGALRVLAGSGARGYADGKGEAASFAHPCGLAMDSEGTLFVADCGNHRIRQVTADGVVSTVAGSGVAAHKDGHTRFAAFYNPCGVAIDGEDVLYVSDYSNNCVRVLSRGGVVSTIGKDVETPLDSPYGIAVHSASGADGPASRIYVSSYHSHSLACVTPDGQVTTLAGCGAARHSDGLGPDAAFHAPNGLSIDSEGVLYVADSGNHCVRRVTPDGQVSTLIGSGQPGLSPTEFNSPCGIAVCSLPHAGACMLVADRSNSCVRLLPMGDGVCPLARLAPSTLRRDLRRLLEAQPAELEGEAVFEVQGAVLRAPKALLCVRCAYFYAMFTSRMRECRETVCVHDVAYVTFRALIDYLLTDETPDELSVPALLDLMMLANRYGVMRLEQLCARMIGHNVSEDTAPDVAMCANLIGSSELHRVASNTMLASAGNENVPIDATA